MIVTLVCCKKDGKGTENDSKKNKMAFVAHGFPTVEVTCPIGSSDVKIDGMTGLYKNKWISFDKKKYGSIESDLDKECKEQFTKNSQEAPKCILEMKYVTEKNDNKEPYKYQFKEFAVTFVCKNKASDSLAAKTASDNGKNNVTLECNSRALMVVQTIVGGEYDLDVIQSDIDDVTFEQKPLGADTVSYQISRGDVKGKISATYQCIIPEAAAYVSA